MDVSLRSNSKWTWLYKNEAVISIENTIHFPYAVLMLSQHRRQWPKIKPTLFYFLMFAGMTVSVKHMLHKQGKLTQCGFNAGDVDL